jgi:hypothetical protein
MKPPAFYVYLQGKFAEHSNKSGIPEVIIIDFLRHYRIPKLIRPKVLLEMEVFGLIRKNGFNRIEVINCDVKGDLRDYSRKTRRKMIARAM